MYRIDDPSASPTLPVPEAALTEGYWTEGNPGSGIVATLERASWFNMVQEELRAIVVAAGLTPSKTTYNQVLSAIKRIGQNTVVLADTGAVNAYTAVNAVPLVAGTWVDGVVQAVKIAHTNTGASTYAPDGLTAIPIYGLGLQPLQGGELLLNGTAILMHATIAGVNSGNPICVLMECAGGAQQVPPATASQHAVQLVQVQSGSATYAADTGTANAYEIPIAPAPSTLYDGMLIRFKASHSNTGASTLALGSQTPIPLLGAGFSSDASSLQGGEIVAGYFYEVVYSVGLVAWILTGQAGGAQQVPPATASQHAVQLGQVGHGQCRLSVTNTTTLTLAPYGGNNLIINGVPRQIPGAGVTISNASLAASTVYYVYASWTGSAIQLNLSATGHSTATSGIETKTGDTTQTLVGMIATNSSSQFVDSATQRFTLNWFNRRGLLGGTGYNTPTSFAVQTATEITSNLRVSFLLWADEAIYFNTEGTVSNNSAGSTVTVQTYIQGTPFGSIVSATSAIANAKVPFSSTATTGNLEGTINIIELYGSVDANTGTLQSGAIHFQTKG
ncbi:hypothetical protein [Paraburkholderia fungorum]